MTDKIDLQELLEEIWNFLDIMTGYVKDPLQKQAINRLLDKIDAAIDQ